MFMNDHLLEHILPSHNAKQAPYADSFYSQLLSCQNVICQNVICSMLHCY